MLISDALVIQEFGQVSVGDGGTAQVNTATVNQDGQLIVAEGGGLTAGVASVSGLLEITGADVNNPSVVAVDDLAIVSGGQFLGDGQGASTVVLDVTGRATIDTGATMSLGDMTLTTHGLSVDGTDSGLDAEASAVVTVASDVQISDGATASISGSLTSPGTMLASGGDLAVEGGAYSGKTLNASGAGTALSVTNGGVMTLNDLTLTDQANAAITGNGSLVTDALTVNPTSMLSVTGSGQVNVLAGTSTDLAGTLMIDNQGSLLVPNGLYLDDATVQGGSGTVQGPVSGSQGAVIAMTSPGTLALGSVSSAVGFEYDGTLDAGSSHVILLDANAAGLGEDTFLATGGTLTAPNGALLELGEVLTATGPATIEGDFTNNGTVNGPVVAGQFLTFDDHVDGAGGYNGNIEFLEGFNPGNSPASVSFNGHMTLGPHATLAIELGGVAAGNEHDQVNVTHGIVTLDGTLDIALINGFNPSPGDMFVILQASEILGSFDDFSGDVLAMSNDLALVPMVDSDINSVTVFATAPGDANLDFKVDAADLNDLALHWQQDVIGWKQGDFNGDGFVNAADLNVLAIGWQFGVLDPMTVSFDDAFSQALARVTPEPGTVGLLVLGGLGLVNRRDTRRVFG